MTDNTTDDGPDLKPCPFCGASTISTDCMGENEWDVECYCGAGIIAVGPKTKDRPSAIEAWNTRTGASQ